MNNDSMMTMLDVLFITMILCLAAAFTMCRISQQPKSPELPVRQANFEPLDNTEWLD